MPSSRRKTSRAAPPNEPSGWSQIAWDLAGRLREHAEDIGAVLLSAAALLTLLGMLRWTSGALVDGWIDLLRRWLGWFSIAVPLTLVAIATVLVLRRLGTPLDIPWLQVIAVEFGVFALMGAVAAFGNLSLAESESGSGGGLIGWGLSALLSGVLGRILAGILLLAVSVAGFIVAARLPGAAPRPTSPLRTLVPTEDGDSEWLPEPRPLEAIVAREREPEESQAPRRSVPREFRKTFKVEAPSEARRRSPERDERLPPYDLLEKGEATRITSREINQMAGLIEKTLADFGLPAKVVDFRTGPAVTQFAVEPGFVEHTTPDGEVKKQKVRVSQISALASDLALALSAPALRIEAPVPGQAYVGIEVPNRRAALVRLRSAMESDAFQRIGSPLSIALGRDVAGEAVAADLAAMPHLLIAGTTGSGKSVCITSLATCLLFNNSPDDLRLVMIDPKMVELVRFNGVAHLIGKVETELERITVVLRWCTAEMDRRYKLLEQAAARDIEAYNRRMRRRRDVERLPRLVIMIDELADLMMMAPDQTEHTLVRLAQMGRATGLHLVVATQRPSTDILTGLIKANFPARISFAVASMIDSRVILDSTGAETLLGKGDMLYVSPEASAPVRIQGAFVDDAEIERLVTYWQEQREVEPEQRRAPWEDMLVRQEAQGDQDEILEQAIELVKQTGFASASMLQRRLRIGYPRAARLMDELEDLGVVGRSQSGGKTREVLIRDEEEEEDGEDDET
ncbi:MAG TPA: DNA translocase FtsK [Anaerolineales bacterium]|nr:DNA translocase FtsK [Anaerolineales bacterium]